MMYLTNLDMRPVLPPSNLICWKKILNFALENQKFIPPNSQNISKSVELIFFSAKINIDFPFDLLILLLIYKSID